MRPTIQGGNRDQIESTAASIGHHTIECRAPLTRAGHGVIDKLADDNPIRTLGMFAESAKWILGGLIARRDPGIESDARWA